jgi:hypothetical protein
MVLQDRFELFDLRPLADVTRHEHIVNGLQDVFTYKDFKKNYLFTTHGVAATGSMLMQR